VCPGGGHSKRAAYGVLLHHLTLFWRGAERLLCPLCCVRVYMFMFMLGLHHHPFMCWHMCRWLLALVTAHLLLRAPGLCHHVIITPLGVVDPREPRTGCCQLMYTHAAAVAMYRQLAQRCEVYLEACSDVLR
jgi:hypothetical protein